MADNSTYEYLKQLFEQIRDERNTSANTATRIGNAFLSLLSYAEGSDNAYLRRDVDDTAAGVITFLQGLVSKGDVYFGENFVSGIVNGIGGRITADADAELNSLVLRESLTVPSITFNSVEIIKGESWQAAGGGEIESVVVESENTGLVTLKLEEGEYGSVAVGDICKAFFHFEDKTENNATETADDSEGNTTYAGFCTIYFWITEITETGNNSQFRYQLRPDGNLVHPQAHTKFVGYGSFADTARQKSAYSTTSYTRYLVDVNDWTFSATNVAMQFGDLSNLSLLGLDMSGYSAYLNNIYMSGTIKQFEDLGRRMSIVQELQGLLQAGESQTVTVTMADALGQDYTSEYTFAVQRESVDTTADATWNATHTDVGSEFTISSSDIPLAEGSTEGNAMFRVIASLTSDATQTVTGTFVARVMSSESSIDIVLSQSAIVHNPAAITRVTVYAYIRKGGANADLTDASYSVSVNDMQGVTYTETEGVGISGVMLTVPVTIYSGFSPSGNITIGLTYGGVTYEKNVAVTSVSNGEDGGNGTSAKYVTVKSSNWDSTVRDYGVYINGVSYYTPQTRGHRIVIIDPSTSTVESSTVYDTYDDETAMDEALANVESGKIICLTSDDATSLSATARSILIECGSGMTSTWSASRVSHAFIGMRGLAQGQAYEKTATGEDSNISITAYYTSDGIVTNGATGADGADGADGRGITSANVMYAVYVDGSAPPVAGSSLWKDTLDDLALAGSYEYSYYIWQWTKVTYTDGTTNDVSSASVIGRVSDFASVTELYILHSSATSTPTMPSGSYTNGWVTASEYASIDKPQGYWLWTCSQLKFKSSSYYSYTTAVCVGRISEDGSDGADGSDGNGISNQYSLYLLSQKSSGVTYDSSDDWTDTFESPTADYPYVWKVTVTEYTQTATVYGTAELIATYQSGVNVNLLDNAAFTGDDNMDAWDTKSVYSVVSGQTKPTDYGVGVNTSQKKDGRNSYYDKCSADGSIAYYKEVLQQTVTEKLEPSTWYTLSFWAKGWLSNITVNTTSSTYGFAMYEMYLVAGRKYTFGFNGKISSAAKSAGASLIVYVFNSDWTDQAHGSTTSTTTTTVTFTFTPSATGTYYINAYLSPNGSSGTATLYYYTFGDSISLTTYVYPSAIDTSESVYYDGVEQVSPPADGAHSWTLTDEWSFHTMTFKTESALDSSTAQCVLFRLLPPASASAYRNLYLCMPKLETGMMFTGFVDSQSDLGFEGQVVRTTEWVLGTEYCNDGTDIVSPRYLDLVTITGTDGTLTGVWQCRVTHVSDSSKMPSTTADTTYWLRMNEMRPIYTSLILAENAVMRFGQANRIIIMSTDESAVQAGFQGVSEDTGIVLWVGGSEPTTANFRVPYNGKMYSNEGTFENATVNGELKGVTGSFKSLNCVNSDGDIVGNLSFGSDGRMWLNSCDLYHQGTKDSRSLRFYASDIWCRGVFGARERAVAVVNGRSVTYYTKGTDSTGVILYMTSSYDSSNNLYYTVPCYGTTGEYSNDNSGFPVDMLVFRHTTSTVYRYLLSMTESQRILLVNVNNSYNNIQIYINGSLSTLNGGQVREVICFSSLQYPTVSGLGAGLLLGAEYDNNW